MNNFKVKSSSRADAVQSQFHTRKIIHFLVFKFSFIITFCCRIQGNHLSLIIHNVKIRHYKKTGVTKIFLNIIRVYALVIIIVIRDTKSNTILYVPLEKYLHLLLSSEASHFSPHLKSQTTVLLSSIRRQLSQRVTEILTNILIIINCFVKKQLITNF